MQLTVREAASYLRVDEATVRRWILRRGLPVHRVNERLHLNAIELWEWATENGIAVSRTLLEQAQRQPEHVPPLSELLSAGGIHHDVGGRDKAGVLREIVQSLPLPAEVDREFLATTLEAREAMGSTGIGDGRPVHALFTVVSANVPGHLRILGQLGFVLHDQELRRLLNQRAPGSEILSRVRAAEGRASGVFQSPQ